MKKLVLSTIFSLLFMSSLGLAANFDVSVGITPKQITVNPCGVALYDIVIEHVGNMKDTYTLQIEGLPENWYSLSQDKVELDSNKTKTVYLFVTASCEGDFGQYSGIVTAKGNSQDSDSFTLNVVTDRSVEITMPEDVASCLCEGGFVTAEIKNTGEHTENLVFSLTSEIAEYLELDKTSLVLESGETDKINIEISEECKPEGEYSLILNANSKTSYVTAQAETRIKLTKCYQFEVVYPEEIQACSGEVNEFNINVKNTGLKQDTYEVSIDELNYTKISQLDPEQDQDFKVSFRKDAGEHTLELVVKSSTQEETYNINVKSEKCYDADLEFEKDTYETGQCQGKLVKATLVNTGTRSDTYIVSCDKDWVIIKPTKIILNPEVSENIAIYCSPSYEMGGEFVIKVSASSEKTIITKPFTLNVMGIEGTTTTLPIETTTTEPIETTLPEETTTTGIGLPNITITLPFGEGEELPGMKFIRPLVIAILIAVIILGGLYWLVMKGE